MLKTNPLSLGNATAAVYPRRTINLGEIKLFIREVFASIQGADEILHVSSRDLDYQYEWCVY